jgi:hypothetical protein
MIQLINGRGQLGKKLTQKFANYQTDQDVAIYHTWKVPYLYNPGESEEEIQKQEYQKLVEFSQSNPSTKIVFISTNSARGTFYTYYKELAEAYLLLNHKYCVILKFPVFVGNGIIKKLKNQEIEPYGVTELMTLDKAVDKVEQYLDYEGLKRVFIVTGERIEENTILVILNL